MRVSEFINQWIIGEVTSKSKGWLSHTLCAPDQHAACNCQIFTNSEKISLTCRLSNKPFLILSLTIPPHLKNAATLPGKLSLMACFADINVSQGSVATRARCGGIFNIDLTPYLPKNLPVKKCFKSVKISQNYGHRCVSPLFWPTPYITRSASVCWNRLFFPKRPSTNGHLSPINPGFQHLHGRGGVHSWTPIDRHCLTVADPEHRAARGGAKGVYGRAPSWDRGGKAPAGGSGGQNPQKLEY